MNTELLVAGLVWYVVFLLSTTCHEAAHAWAAKLGGDLTAFHGGQVSLDPLPHIRREPFGMVLFPILTYIGSQWMMGWASAPYDPHWAQRHPKRAAWMSLAGPCANFALAIIAAILIRVGMLAGILRLPDLGGSDDIFLHVVAPVTAGVASGIATFLSLMFSLNLLLGCFNLIPIPPLDGFGVVGLFLPEDAGRRFQQFGWSLGMFTFVGLLIAWRLFEPIFFPIFGFSLRMLYLV
jgi:Zn-dependent protease